MTLITIGRVDHHRGLWGAGGVLISEHTRVHTFSSSVGSDASSVMIVIMEARRSAAERRGLGAGEVVSPERWFDCYGCSFIDPQAMLALRCTSCLDFSAMRAGSVVGEGRGADPQG